MKFKRPKITTMLIVFALIIYGGVLIVTIQASTREVENVNRQLAQEAARLEIEVAELEFAINRYVAYENARMYIEELREQELALKERIRELEEAALDSTVYETNEAGVRILKRDLAEIEADIALKELELIYLQNELDTAIANFNAVDASSVIAEIAREHLGLTLPGEIILHSED